jgi:hypothetical protein
MSDAITTDIPFAIVPVWLMELRPSNAALRVYIALARRADNGTGEAWPGRSTIAKEAGVSLRSVDRGIAELERSGALTKRRRVDEHGNSKSSLYTVYRARRGGVMGDTSAMGDTPPCQKSTTELDLRTRPNNADEVGAVAPVTPDLPVLEPGRIPTLETAASKSNVQSSERAITDDSYAARLLERLGDRAPDLDGERMADNYMALFLAAKKTGEDVHGVAIGLTLGLLVKTFGPLPGQARGMVARLAKSAGPTTLMQAAVTTAGSTVGSDAKYADDPLGPVRYLAGVARGGR